MVRKRNKKKRTTFFEKLVENNTGVSSKNFFLVIVTSIGCLLLFVPVFTLIVEAIFQHTITTDLFAMAAYITAVSAIFASAGITKVYAEKFEKPFDRPDDESNNNSDENIDA